MESALCLVAFLLVPLFAWIGHREDRRRARAASLPCRCREIAGRYVVSSEQCAAWNAPRDMP